MIVNRYKFVTNKGIKFGLGTGQTNEEALERAKAATIRNFFPIYIKGSTLVSSSNTSVT